MNSGRLAAFVSLFRLRVEVTFCWSPAERSASSASSLLFASHFQTLFEELTSRRQEGAEGQRRRPVHQLLPRSRRRLVLSSMNTFCSKLLASGASSDGVLQVYDALTWKPCEMRCWKFTIISRL